MDELKCPHLFWLMAILHLESQHARSWDPDYSLILEKGDFSLIDPHINQTWADPEMFSNFFDRQVFTVH